VQCGSGRNDSAMKVMPCAELARCCLKKCPAPARLRVRGVSGKMPVLVPARMARKAPEPVRRLPERAFTRQICSVYRMVATALQSARQYVPDEQAYSVVIKHTPRRGREYIRMSENSRAHGNAPAQCGGDGDSAAALRVVVLAPAPWLRQRRARRCSANIEIRVTRYQCRLRYTRECRQTASVYVWHQCAVQSASYEPR